MTFDRRVENAYATVEGKKVHLVSVADDEVTVGLKAPVGPYDEIHRVRPGGKDSSLGGYLVEVREITAERVVIVVTAKDA